MKQNLGASGETLENKRRSSSPYPKYSERDSVPAVVPPSPRPRFGVLRGAFHGAILGFYTPLAFTLLCVSALGGRGDFGSVRLHGMLLLNLILAGVGGTVGGWVFALLLPVGVGVVVGALGGMGGWWGLRAMTLGELFVSLHHEMVHGRDSD